MQQVNFKHCWIDSASARYEQEYMISFIISQKSVMPDRILRRYLLSSTSPAAASVRLLISTAPLSTLFYSLHSFATYVNPFMRILNFYTFCPLRHWLPLFGREGARPASNHVFYVKRRSQVCITLMGIQRCCRTAAPPSGGAACRGRLCRPDPAAGGRRTSHPDTDRPAP